MNLKSLKLPKNIFLLGYGAVGKCFTKIALNNLSGLNLTVCDIYDLPSKPKGFKYINKKLNAENLNELGNIVQKGDVIVDLSTNVDVASMWKYCMNNGVNYMNTAMEEGGESMNPKSFPTNLDEMHKTSLGHRHEMVEQNPLFNPNQGTTSVFEHGMNPGLISHFAKKGLIDAAEYFLKRKDWNDINHKNIEKHMKDKNFPKLAQEMGLHTIHCSETDDQTIENPPKDIKTKFYNTWSCRGFLTEGLVPIQVARGSHEDEQSEKLPRLKDGKTIMSWAPSCHYWAKSWVPFENIEGALIPHGEAYTIREFFSDKETGYAPSQYYVYNFNKYAQEFIKNLPKDATLQNCNPEMEVIHPSKYKIKGYDKVGAMLIFKNNRGWWSGTIMDDIDSSMLLDNEFGPTVIQVGGGVFSAFVWMINNPNVGNKWAEQLDSDFILETAKPYLGRIWSKYVDLNNTHIKDCYKLESFLTRTY